MTDPIFAAAAYLEKVWVEIDHLVPEVVQRLSNEKLVAENVEDGGQDADSGLTRYAYHLRLKQMPSARTRKAQVVLYFDLARPERGGSWAPGHSALLVVGYDRDYDDGWDTAHFAFDAAGRFEDDDSAESIRPARDFGGRIMVWNEADTHHLPWIRREWFFAIELARIRGPDDIDTRIMKPLLAIMRSDPDAAQLLVDAEAVVWPGA